MTSDRSNETRFDGFLNNVENIDDRPFAIDILVVGQGGKLVKEGRNATHICDIKPRAKKDTLRASIIKLGGVYAVYENTQGRILYVAKCLSDAYYKYCWNSERYDKKHYPRSN